MTEIPAAPEVARRLADVLEDAAIPYAVGGALAYGFHGPPRATNDVDLNLFVGPDRLPEALGVLAAVADVDHEEALRSAEQRGDLIVRVDGMRVDVFVPSIPLVEQAAKRVQRAVLLGRPITVLSAEDLVLFKLLFFRSKDLADVERLVAFKEDLDRAYVRRWLIEMVGEDDERTRTWDRFTKD